jgi:hypothetical protein
VTAVPSRQELLAAIDDPDATNPLALNIVALLDGYTAALNAQARRAGAIPETVILAAPNTEIEAFALELFTSHITSMGVRVEIKGDS